MDNTVLAAIIGAVIGVLGTYLSAILKYRQDLRAEYDKDLREKRIPEYKCLWRWTELFPKYAHTKEVTYQDVQALSVNLRDWYFRNGGMFLSDRSKDAYFAVQDALTKTTEKTNQNMTAPIDPVTYEMLRKKCSSLRTELTGDVGTRKEPELD
jgi:hypothetical protein